MAVGSNSSGYDTTTITARLTLAEAIEKICFGELSPMDVYAQLPGHVQTIIDMLAHDMSPEFVDAGGRYRIRKDFARLGSDQQLSVFRELRSHIKETTAATDRQADESGWLSPRAILACVLLVISVPSYMMFAAGAEDQPPAVAQLPLPVKTEARALAPAVSDAAISMTQSNSPDVMAQPVTAAREPDGVGANAASAGLTGRGPAEEERETVATVEALPAVQPTPRSVRREASAVGEPPIAIMEKPPLGMAPSAPTMQVEGNQVAANSAAADADAGKVAVAPSEPFAAATPMTSATTMAPGPIKRPAPSTSAVASLSASAIAGSVPLPRQRPRIISRMAADETRPQGLDFFLPPAFRNIFR
jgi:hypothetical protein